MDKVPKPVSLMSNQLARIIRDPLGLEAIGQDTVKIMPVEKPTNGKGKKRSLHKQRAVLRTKINRILTHESFDSEDSNTSYHVHRGAVSGSDSDSDSEDDRHKTVRHRGRGIWKGRWKALFPQTGY